MGMDLLDVTTADYWIGIGVPVLLVLGSIYFCFALNPRHPAPRYVRWRSVLAFYWWLNWLVLVGALLVGGLFLWKLLHAQ
jgi:hypothetical protein